MLDRGLYSGRRLIACSERLVYNWGRGAYKWRGGGGGGEPYNRLLQGVSTFSQIP